MTKLKLWLAYHIEDIMYAVLFAGILGLMAISYRFGQLGC